MKKSMLSLAVILSFSAYTAFLRSSDISGLFSDNNPIPTLPNENNPVDNPNADSTTQPGDKVARTTNCVYIPDIESSENEDDNETEEEDTGTSNGHYKCTTTIVPAPSPAPTPVTSTPNPTPAPTPTPTVPPKNTGKYKNGTYIGDSVDAFYGNVQVSIDISGGRLSNITFLDYPRDRRTSLQKSNHAMPILESEAISAQSANVDTVSGATYTSEAFIISLGSALNQAKNI